MADEVTNGMLLAHMQGMKNDLQQQIVILNQKIDGLAQKVNEGFEDARLHRQALQEDLDATIRMVGKHEVKLARMS